jgi:hypothetical protein
MLTAEIEQFLDPAGIRHVPRSKTVFAGAGTTLVHRNRRQFADLFGLWQPHPDGVAPIGLWRPDGLTLPQR